MLLDKEVSPIPNFSLPVCTSDALRGTGERPVIMSLLFNEI